MENFKDWLRRQIAKNDWTYEELGGLIGAKQSSISQWVNGKHFPEPRVLLRLADVTHEDRYKLLNMVYDWPMPEKSDEADEDVEQILRMLQAMPEPVRRQAEKYIDFLLQEARKNQDAEL